MFKRTLAAFGLILSFHLLASCLAFLISILPETVFMFPIFITLILLAFGAYVFPIGLIIYWAQDGVLPERLEDVYHFVFGRKNSHD